MIDLAQAMNTIYIPLLDNTSRYLVLRGGRGSGKSHFLAQKWLLRVLGGLRKGIRHRVLALRKTQPAARRSVFQLFKDYISSWDLGWLVNIRDTDMSIKFNNYSEIVCGGLDEPEKIKSFEKPTGVWLEETTEFTQMDFNMLDLTLRGDVGTYYQVTMSFNPVDINMKWLKEMDEMPNPDVTALKTTYRDNRFIDAKYKEILERLKGQDEALWKIYGLGEWAELQSLIYSQYDVIGECPEFDEVIYGIDFGFNNPSVVLEIGIKDNEYWIRELLYESYLTTADLITRMKELIPEKSRYIYADSAEPKTIAEIGNAGFNVFPSQKGQDSVLAGINLCKQVKKHITGESTNVLKELQSYKWKEDRQGNVIDEPVAFNNHAMDAMRYAIYTHGASFGSIPRVVGVI